MSISFYIVIVGFLAVIAVQGASVDQTSNSKEIQDEQYPTTTILNFNEAEIELVTQAPLNNDTETELKTQDEIILSTINENQKDLVKQFQLANNELLSNEYFRSANFVFGLLSRNNWNIPATVKYFKRFLKWRKSNNIPELGTTEADPELSKIFPYSVAAVDRKGCPVLECPAGKWFLADYMDSKEFVRDALKSYDVYTTQALEKTRLASQKMMSTCNEAVIFLMDITGFTTRNYAEANALSAIVRTSTIIENYYPNLFKTVIFFNANPDWANLITILTPYISQTVLQIKVFNNNETEQAKDFMYNLIDPEQLTYKYLNV